MILPNLVSIFIHVYEVEISTLDYYT